MKDLLSFILGKLVDFPEQVQIEEKETGENAYLYEVTLAKEDMGKVIGKEGKIIKAIRTIVKIPAVKEGKLVRIELLEKE
ncbi:MAG: hypothetical protein UT63_C0049G0018 [Candidatus Gottesmanbacteria bacterium GW2011_GWC2_39_8]|uniref:RNA-binding protein KhpA n=1 Tax=Candidatus Gottesmanbacteria bacterium GW2011_GWC2_39_8 TaxID=1618450 RepID=A0A0G0PVN5_9BACT|nr:MAG: hypothetical protein UT63_C0049G0018 [Candidatus Gottesmanbacteria bacterium GW2011_GWC2_39_8]